MEHDVRLKDGEVSILGGLLQRTETGSVNGWPGLAQLPFFRYFFSDNKKEVQDDEVLIVLTPHIIRFPDITKSDLQWLASGTDTNVRVFRYDETPLDSSAPASPPAHTSISPSPIQPPATNGLHFVPSMLNLKTGDTATIGLAVSQVDDLFSIPLLVHYNPAVIQIEDIRNGGFLSGGNQEIAIVQRVDESAGKAIVSARRQPNSSGVTGSGTLLGIVVRAIAPGTSPLQILQVEARDSQQKPIPLVSGEATIQVR